MKISLNLIFILLFSVVSFDVLAQDSVLNKFEARLMLGDKSALFEIAPYFDSTKKVTEFLGYHIFDPTQSQIAERIVEENCFFTDEEIKITGNTTAKQFSAFLTQHKDKIFFSTLAQAFLLTPLENRTTKFDIREISNDRKLTLKKMEVELKSLDWVKRDKIDSLIRVKDPKALLLIASALFKVRYRFNRGYFKQNEFTDLLQLLTGTEIAVDNEKGELSWHVEKEFYPQASLNLLVYFAANYAKYKWDGQISVFTNGAYKAKSIGNEERLFQLLNNENDSIAMDAFTQLTTCDPIKVTRLADEYEKAGINNNFAMPIFPYRFLRQMVVLTEYCKNENIDFAGSLELRNDIEKLDSGLSFTERRKLENRLINSLTLNEITTFEYWALINEQSYQLTYSAGRILDIFYSKNWDNLISDKKQLQLYLEKSILFDRLGIIGICNNYLAKFKNASVVTIEKLNSFQTNDPTIKLQIEKAKKIAITKLERPNIAKREFDGNRDYNITDVQHEIASIIASGKDSSETEDQLVALLSKINYTQIGVALKAIEDIKFSTGWKKYSFMERDFGFFMLDNFDSISSRNSFLKSYNKLSEYGLYEYYLDKAGIDYKSNDASLDYDKIYELLKYDIVTAFVGGGGGKKDNEAYPLIKLLEIKYNTTLGYPHKLCNSNGMWGCSSDDRAKEWMQYFVDKKLLKKEHNRSVSFGYK